VGHVRLGVLPRSRKWQQVVEQLRLGADVAAVAGLAADAAETSLKGASNDPAFLHAFWLLTQIPLAARGPAFAEDLRRLGIEVPDQPSLMDVAAAFSSAVDRYARQRGGRTDLGEMAQLAAVESLTATVGPTLPSLLGPTPEEVQRAFGRFSGGDPSAHWPASSTPV
jgi:uroporphyrinogen-III synthase